MKRFELCFMLVFFLIYFFLTIFLHQALDEEYLKVDAQFGGVDQRKIFMFAEKVWFTFFFEYFAHRRF